MVLIYLTRHTPTPHSSISSDTPGPEEGKGEGGSLSPEADDFFFSFHKDLAQSSKSHKTADFGERNSPEKWTGCGGL